MGSGTASPRLILPVSESDHGLGPKTAPVTLLEYGDYECPYCGQAHPIVKKLMELMGPRLRFVFRHFPLTTIHPNAQTAAEAAEAAGAQGQFWAMHDMLYENQAELDIDSLVEYAAEIGLDLTRFKRELASHVHAARVRELFKSGVMSGVNGTPAFYINGVRHDGPWDLESLLAAVEMAMRLTTGAT